MAGQAAEKEGERKGDFLGGKYLLEDCLGIGGMGEVYRATNVSLGRKVAIKLLNKEHTANEDDVMRFLREARAAAAVRHPNVVDVFDVARDDDGTPFIVQELLSGQDLEQYLGASGGKIPADEALEIMIPVADAVAAAHARDVVHRDLKPANIFLAKEGAKIIPKVLDFGACLYQTVGALSAKERRMLIGTPHYMAPEQITTAMDVDARADVWAMGVILYELLVGETPFEAEDANAVLKLVRTRSVPRLRKVAPNAPESLEELVMQCLDRDRRKRLPDAAAVREQLAKIRKELRPARRKRVDTDSDLDSDPHLRIPDRSESRAKPERAPAPSPSPARVDARSDEPPSQRIPSLVLKGSGRPPTKRRGSSLLTLSSPEEPVRGDTDPPKSASRPIEAAKPARTAADVIRDAEASSTSALGASASPSGAPSKSQPPSRRDPRVPSLRSSPAPAMPPPLARSAPDPSSPPPRSSPREQGAPRNLDFDEVSDPSLDLDLSPQPSRHKASASSIPPVLDPRAASPGSRGAQERSDRPPASLPSPLSDRPGRISRISRSEISPLTPPLTTTLSGRTTLPGRTTLSGVTGTGAGGEAPKAQLPWTAASRGSFAAAIVIPAVVAFVALRFAPFVMAPLGHAMHGDSPLASGVLAVITLVGAAALATRALGSSRSPGMVVATAGAVVLGIVMIIVTFSSSETVELGMPPAAGGIVPFIAPIVPLGLGLVGFARARATWVSRYERGDAIRSVIFTSLMLFMVLQLGPFGAVHAAALTPTVPTTTAPVAPHS